MSTPATAIRQIKSPTEIGTLVADPLRQYVISQSTYAAEQLAKTLTEFLDDLSIGFTSETVEQMLTDYEIAKNMKVIKTSVLGERMTLSPAVAEGHERFERAQEIVEFHTRSLEHLERSGGYTVRDICWMMLDHMAFGNKVGEITFTKVLESGRDRMKMYLDSINILPRKSVGFVMSRWGRHIGFVGRTKDQPYASFITAQPDPRVVIPRDKFWVCTNDPRDNDPRGRSILRPCFILWRMKCDALPEWMRWLAFVALPFLVGTAAQGLTQQKKMKPDGTPDLNTDGSPKFLTQEEALAEVLARAVITRAIAVPHGATVEGIEVGDGGGKGNPFSNTFNFLDTAITATMLLQALATREGEHSTRAQAGVHVGIQDLLVYFVKGVTCDGFRKDVLKLSTMVNFGPDDVDLAPVPALGDTERRDWAKEGATLAQLVNANYFTDEQYREMDIQFGVPPRPMGWRREPEREVALQGGPQQPPPAKRMTPDEAEAYAVNNLKATRREAMMFAAAFKAMDELLRGAE